MSTTQAMRQLIDENATLKTELERLQGELKARHQRQHDAETLAGEYLLQRDDARAELERLRAQVAEWESKLTAVMPADFKDWHQNSKAEWPALAADVIRSQREDRDLGWEMAARAQVAELKDQRAEAESMAADAESRLRAQVASLSREAWTWSKELEAQLAAQIAPAELGPLAKRNVFDAIRSAYDLGYNDARNARAVPGDGAPGYQGRDVEADHGGALVNTLNCRLAAAPAAPAQQAGWYFKELQPSRTMLAIEPSGHVHTVKAGRFDSSDGRRLLNAMVRALASSAPTEETTHD